MAASNFPVPAPMDIKGDLVTNWHFFKDQWSDYEIATELDPKIRVASLRTVMGKECFEIFKTLNLSEEDAADPARCIEALEGYFEPKRNEIYERYRFYTCDQGPEETVDTWVTRLRQLIKSCGFAAVEQENLIRDRLVLGTRDKAARTRMFREKALDLNLALDMLRASEVTTSQIRAMDKSEEQVNFKESRTNYNNKTASSKTVSCKFCLKKHLYGKEYCPAF